MVTPPRDPVQAALAPLYGQPCWQARLGDGSFLTFEFGPPHLEVREPLGVRELEVAPDRLLRMLRRRPVRRHVWVKGAWHLWIYCCDWFIIQGGVALAHSESSRRTMEAAVRELDGQALVRVERDPTRGRWLFRFDLGGLLLTQPGPPSTAHYEPADEFEQWQLNKPAGAYEQWFLYEPSDWVLSVRADGGYSHHTQDTRVGEEDWQPLPSSEGSPRRLPNDGAGSPEGPTHGCSGGPRLGQPWPDAEACAAFIQAREHYHRGTDLAQSRQHESALAEFERVVELDPACTNAQYDCGRMLSELGRHEEALRAFDRVLDLEPDRASAHDARGIVLLDLGRHEEACAAFGRASALLPNWDRYHCNQGCALQRLGRHEEALAAMDRALALNPNRASYHRNRGETLAMLGRYEEARAAYEQALALQPGWDEAERGRQAALERLDRG